MAEENKEEVKQENNAEDVNMENELLKTKQELEETTDRFKRIMAEFENFKKEAQKKGICFIIH